MAVLLQAPVLDVLWISLSAVAAVAALSAGIGGWMRGAATPIERALAIAAAALLFVPRPAATVAGAALLSAVGSWHWVRTSATREHK
jgi:TRAP-type uncharacterized transport system fused permease subunit